ncbi:Protein CBG24416 [Caenorhabditis briggsae]|uniref:BTB domain-containing protein n=2 Tax=Caenorhabditis briggsae TaxID=6238 RepID=A0AAE9JAK2_CAEBR|nr:Protein CBG24416 [Caenorhabditis briggsae]ULU08581.1 hypothetical protein L3Y34_019646 [Caenorhabditis briggsae]UMM20486.1 hypothetical protein L5515_015743 [Caenorhabditis briggsae]CAP21031.1 Protein CBG24416 [Caenorhabditis briggsae]
MSAGPSSSGPPSQKRRLDCSLSNSLEDSSAIKKLFDFSKNDTDLYDGIVKVEGQLFYVMKGHLARHSDFFRGLFFTNFVESREKIVELKEISAESFQIFLELISGGNGLTDSNVEGVLKISGVWFASLPFEKCQRFVIERSSFNKKEKLVLADKYNLEPLKKLLFDDVKTITDLDILLPDTEAEINGFSADTHSRITKKSLEFLKIARPRQMIMPTQIFMRDYRLQDVTSWIRERQEAESQNQNNQNNRQN